jgi:tetratricopeptide (TPR) repeat protein
MSWFEHSLRLNEEHFGKEHAATARSVIGIGNCHCDNGDLTAGAECFDLAIERIKAAGHPFDHADAHAQALQHVAGVHLKKKEWTECIEFATQSVQIRESKHEHDHSTTAAALGMQAFAHGKLGDPEKEMELMLRVLQIKSKAKGALSQETAFTCHNIGEAHRRANRAVDAVKYFKQALDGQTFISPDHPETEAFRRDLREVLETVLATPGAGDPQCMEAMRMMMEAVFGRQQVPEEAT